MTIIRNLTPHVVRFCNAKGDVIATFTPEDLSARAAQNSVSIGTLVVGAHELPLVRTEFGSPVNLPDPREGVFLIVSLATAQAAKETGRGARDLLVPNDLVRDEDGQIIGARNFALIDDLQTPLCLIDP
jgi:hypothetical protein